MARKVPAREYIYSHVVRLAEDTHFLRFVKAMAERTVVYDPGIKLEGATSARPLVKRRSQFRIRSADVGSLYARLDAAALAPLDPANQP